MSVTMDKRGADDMDEKRKEVSHARSNAGNTHIAGEMFVAAELAKRGYSVSLTMGNAKAVDLFAERNGRAICVQVKALAHKRNVGWPLPIARKGRATPNGSPAVHVRTGHRQRSRDAADVVAGIPYLTVGGEAVVIAA